MKTTCALRLLNKSLDAWIQVCRRGGIVFTSGVALAEGKGGTEACINEQSAGQTNTGPPTGPTGRVRETEFNQGTEVAKWSASVALRKCTSGSLVH